MYAASPAAHMTNAAPTYGVPPHASALHGQHQYGYRINWTRLVAIGLAAIIALTLLAKVLDGGPGKPAKATSKRSAAADTRRSPQPGGTSFDATAIEPDPSATPTPTTRSTKNSGRAVHARIHRRHDVARIGGSGRQPAGIRGSGRIARSVRRGTLGGGALRATRVGTAQAASGTGQRGAFQTAAGGGKLPYTGAPLWLAFVLGLMFVSLGVASQRRAEAIGEIPLHYRRGPLLRPLRLLQRCVVRALDHVAP